MSSSSPSDPYEQFAMFYDLYVGDWLDDLPFYADYARRVGSSVLEIGAGSGRLTIPLAREGVSVVAIDRSPSMLSIMESRLAEEPAAVRGRVEPVRADACDLDLGGEYELIIVPYFTFNYFLTTQAQRRALERLRVHLSRQGLLLIDVFIPWSRIEHCPTDPILKVEAVDPSTGAKVRGWNTYTMDTERQIELRQHRFETIQDDGRLARFEFTTERRYSFPNDLETSFASAGLSIEGAFAGYTGAKAADRSEQIVYVLARG